MLAWTADVYGATPLALAGALALSCFGASAGCLLRLRGRAAGALGAVALGLAAAAPGLGAALPSPSLVPLDAPTWIGAVACLGIGLVGGAATPRARGGVAWAVASLAVLAGASWPGAGALVALVLVVAGAQVRMRPAESQDWRPVLGVAAAVAWGLGVAVATAGWSAVRGSLDPTVGGAAVALTVGLLGAATGRGLHRLQAPTDPAPRGLWGAAAAALVLLVLLALAPERSWQLLAQVAGRSDPRPTLWLLLGLAVLPGAVAAGWALGTHRTGPWGRAALWLATGVGLIVGLDAGPDLRVQALALAAVVGSLELCRPTLWGRLRGAALVGGALAVLTAPLPWPEARMPEGRMAHLQDERGPDRHASRLAASTPVAAGWGPGGTVLLTRRPDGGLLHITEGLPRERVGRLADAQRMAGHLARALAPRFDRALVLGDGLGLVTGALVRDLVERTTVAVPQAEALRALAEASEPVSAALLHPSVSLVRGGPEQVVRQADDQDIVVEVALTPWQDGEQGLPGPRQLRARRELLEARQGLYLLVLDVTRFDTDSFRGVLADVLEVFPQTWAFLPPSGADQILLASWTGEARANWDQFLAVEGIARTALSELGMGSALDLADRAAVGPTGLAALAADGVGGQRRWLPHDLHVGPTLVVELLEPHLEGPSAWLEVGPLTSVHEVLEDRVETKRSFLRVLAGAARGDTKTVFEESRALLGADGGAQALDPLLTPYMVRAQELLREARRAGLGSRKWTDALGELEAARLMNPRSTAVLAMLADTHLALGNVPEAERGYALVLELDPGHLQALLGRAQAALVMDRFDQAEGFLVQAAERNVQSWMAHHNLGEFLANAHRYPEAERHLKLAIDLSGGTRAAPFAALSTVYLEQGDTAASLLQASRALSLEDSAEHRYVVARAHYELENLSIAMNHAQQGALQSASHLGCQFILGLIQARRLQHTQCVRTFKRVLELQPGSEPAIANLRRCQAAADREAAAALP